ncbi:large conductance mechanosensitive channel protein MscL [Agromyces sp. SYSU K20354]|uniref:large conductance mechanosensitive channel protein MscL n=1 Tax=Agromyces cavernae TaxID=2898659 RepID=UPI001E4EC91F|nr:large conductance mechanosensitive channel protein MscL [Agromyces cavernae]MCD2444301.1 large conductance mechanosensitive channel protein MscL [Agromyces cavernae]
MLQGFKEFITRGNVIDLAVAVVIGAAFTAVVNSIVNGLITPLLGLLFRADSLDGALILQVGDAKFTFGAVLGAIISFLAVALVVYLVFVLPMNTYRERQQAKIAAGEPADEPPTETQLLEQIRDLLAEQRGAPSGRHSD